MTNKTVFPQCVKLARDNKNLRLPALLAETCSHKGKGLLLYGDSDSH